MGSERMLLAVSCDNLKFILRIAAYLLKVIQWVIPILLILLITFDFLKAVIGGDEKKSKEALTKVGKRLLYAVILFLIPMLVKMIFREVGKVNSSGFGGEVSPTSWVDCFNQVLKEV